MEKVIKRKFAHRKFHHKKSAPKYHGTVVGKFMPRPYEDEYTYRVQEITKVNRLAMLPNGYFISDDARYFRIKEEQNCITIYEITPTKNNSGYMQVSNPYTLKGAMLLHRLVMMSFNPPIDNNRNCVDHIDGNKEHNHLQNLRWCTHKENMKFYYEMKHANPI